MARCKSWRFIGAASGADPAAFLPVGGNRAYWATCRNRVAVGTERCDVCETSLIMCPNISVRRALVNEAHPSLNVLQSLTSDSNPAIALIAEQKLSDSEHDDTIYDHHQLTAVPTAVTSTASVWS